MFFFIDHQISRGLYYSLFPDVLRLNLYLYYLIRTFWYYQNSCGVWGNDLGRVLIAQVVGHDFKFPTSTFEGSIAGACCLSAYAQKEPMSHGNKGAE